MAEGGASPPSETECGLGSTFEREMEELGEMFLQSGDTLKEAFSPEVRDLLRSASESADASPDAGSSETTSPTSASNYLRQMMKDFYRFINEELMVAPTEQQLEEFRKFLKRVGSRLTLPGNASPGGTAAFPQCLTVVKAMKEVVSTRFSILHEHIEKWKAQGPVGSSPGADSSVSQPREHVSNMYPSGGAQPNVHERKPVLRFCPPRNVGVIAENPMYAAGNIKLPTAGQQAPRSGVIAQVSPVTSGSRGVAEVDRGNRSSPAKRKPLKRQSHVIEDDD